jgi:tetratricopeptide (TPR) repeat protein
LLAPDDSALLEALVRAYKQSEQWAPAADRLEDLVKLIQGTARVPLAQELAEIADEKLASAERAEKALLAGREADPADAATVDKLRALYEKHGSYEKLAALLGEQEAGLSDPPAKVALLLRIAAVYRGQLSDAARAAGQLERAIALVPDDRDVLMQLCDLYIEAGRSQDAIPVLEKLVASYGGRRAKEVAVYEHKLGQAYEGLSKLDEALQHYDAAFKVDLTSVPILRDLGRLCMSKGDFDRAQKTYRALLLQKLTPASGITKADVYFRLGEISFRQGDKLKAKAMLERALAEGGGHAEAQALLDQC